MMKRAIAALLVAAGLCLVVGVVGHARDDSGVYTVAQIRRLLTAHPGVWIGRTVNAL